MKKRVIAVALLAAMALTGCGSKGFTGEKTGEVVSEKGDKTISTVKFEDGKPVSVNIDVTLADGSIKSEASANGTYDMKNDGLKWHEQIDALEEAIVANDFDLSKITLINDKGNTDAVTGVSIKVGDYISTTQDALDQAANEK